MKYVSTCVLVACLFGLTLFPLSAAPVFISCPKPDNEKLKICMWQWVQSEAAALGIPEVAAAVIKDGEVFHIMGYQDEQGVDNRFTPFILNSLSKSITAVAVMQLVESGKLELDSPISQYLDNTPADKSAITIRQLLNHTSGFSTPSGALLAYGSEVDDTALESGVSRMMTLPLATAPGSSFAYSNSNYNLLGYIVQHISGESYEDYVKTHIFTPLGMTTARGLYPRGLAGVVSGYTDFFGSTVAYKMPYGRAYTPAGYIVASVNDLIRFVQAQLNGGELESARILSTASIETLQQASVQVDDQTSYALGWFVKNRYGKTVLRHNGTGPAFHSLIMVDPESKTGVIVLMNKNKLTQMQRYDQLGEGLYALAVDQPIPPVPAEDLLDQIAIPVAALFLVAELLLFIRIVAAFHYQPLSWIWNILLWIISLVAIGVYVVYLPLSVMQPYEYILRDIPDQGLLIVSILLMVIINGAVWVVVRAQPRTFLTGRI